MAQLWHILRLLSNIQHVSDIIQKKFRKKSNSKCCFGAIEITLEGQIPNDIFDEFGSCVVARNTVGKTFMNAKGKIVHRSPLSA